MFIYWPVSIDVSIGISIDTLVESSTDYSIRILIDHGIYPFLTLVYKCFNIYIYTTI